MRTISTPDAPKAIGPYSQAVSHGSLVFCSGQIGLEPHSGTLLANDVQGQTRQVMKNIEAVLQEAGTGLENIVKTTIYLANMADFPVVNAVYAEYFSKDNPPARATVAVTGLPLGALVEIDCIAVVDCRGR